MEHSRKCPQSIHENCSEIIKMSSWCHMFTSPVILPMVGMVVTISPSFSLYNIVVLPAASRPTVKHQECMMGMRFSNIEDRNRSHVSLKLSEEVMSCQCTILLNILEYNI